MSSLSDTNSITGLGSSNGVSNPHRVRHQSAVQSGTPESVTYNNTSGNPNTANRTISWVVNDGDSNSAAVTSTITVAAVNDAPTVSDAAGTRLHRKRWRHCH